MTITLQQASKLAQALALEALWPGVGDQRRHQKKLETELFTHCDDMDASEVGLHWSFDWLFEPGQSLSSAVGRVFGRAHKYAQVALKHQSKDRGIVCEVHLPLESYRYRKDEGVLTVSFEGSTNVRICRLHGIHEERELWVKLDLKKKINSESRPWRSEGSLIVGEGETEPAILSWSWDYHFLSIVDRPDYNIESLLDLLSADAIPGGIGHFIPTLSGEVEGRFTYEEAGVTYGSNALQGGYTDGNFSRTSADNASRLVHDHWGWLAMPRLWSVYGVPVEHMFMAGFFKAPLLPELLGEWSGVVLWRRGPDEISPFRLKTLMTSVEVRQHSAKYLDVTMITYDHEHRITFRMWSQPMISQFVPPESETFRDHQDLLADGYVIVEQNVASWPWRRLRPKWCISDRLVTHMAGSEFGERENVIGNPDYPAYSAVPSRPEWFVRALSAIPGGALTQQFTAHRLESIQPPA